MQSNNPPLLLDVEQAMAALGISRGTIYHLINSGEIRSLKVGPRRRKISRSALDDYIAKQESRVQTAGSR
jgi:excisionase family DNA binding protein